MELGILRLFIPNGITGSVGRGRTSLLMGETAGLDVRMASRAIRPLLGRVLDPAAAVGRCCI